MVADYLIFAVYGKLVFRTSYIEYINTPTYNNTRKVLSDFSDMSGGQIVSFDKIQLGRPITISEIEYDDDTFAPEVLGVAYPSYTKCNIKIRKDLEDSVFRETLIHEYLHCYGYWHVLNENDLMNPTLNPVDKEENIRHYARSMKEYFYE